MFGDLAARRCTARADPHGLADDGERRSANVVASDFWKVDWPMPSL